MTAKDVELVSLSSDLFMNDFDVYQQYEDKYWGLVDCISFVIMWERNIVNLLSFENHFSPAGFTRLPLLYS